MNRNKIILPVIVSLVATIIFFIPTQTASAITFDEIISGVKSFIPAGEKEKKEAKVESSIGLAPGGDQEKNGEIDSGDIVRFTYKIINETDNDYTFGTIETNIDKKKLNFIHNVTGTSSLRVDKRTIAIPNLRISAKQMAVVSFDARINYNQNGDTVIATEARFIDKDKKLITKSSKKEIKAKPIDIDKLPGKSVNKKVN